MYVHVRTRQMLYTYVRNLIKQVKRKNSWFPLYSRDFVRLTSERKEAGKRGKTLTEL